MKNYIHVHNLSKSYKSDHENINALENISFDLKRGEFITIAGPSGCGKSTLLHIIANLMEPSDGRKTFEI